MQLIFWIVPMSWWKGGFGKSFGNIIKLFSNCPWVMVTAYDEWHRIISPTSSIHAGDQTRCYLLLCLLRDNLYGLIFSIALRFEIWIRKLFYKPLFAYFALGQTEVLNPINRELVSSDEMTLFCFWCKIPFHLSLIFRKVDQPKVDPEDESLARGEKIIWQG